MKIRLPLLFLLLLAAGCTARPSMTAPAPTAGLPPAVTDTALPAPVLTALAPTDPPGIVTPGRPTATAPADLAAPSATPTEISPLVLTLNAPTRTPGAPAAPTPEEPLAFTPLFRDSFDDASKGWVLSEGMEIAPVGGDGALRMWTGSRDINAVVVPLKEHTQADVRVKVDAQVVRWDGTSSLMFGAGCRMDESTYDQYMMFVGPLGKDKAMVQFAKFKGGRLAQMTELPQVFALPGDITKTPVSFEFICQGKTLAVKVGGQAVASVEDAEFTQGSVDLFVMGKDKQAAVVFDNVEVGGIGK